MAALPRAVAAFRLDRASNAITIGEDGVIPISRFAEKLTIGVPVNAFGIFPENRPPVEIIVTGGGTNTY